MSTTEKPQSEGGLPGGGGPPGSRPAWVTAARRYGPIAADLGGVDDSAVIWFDATATGEDEIGQQGTGMYRYADGGRRYTPGDAPTSLEEAGLFDVEASETIYDDVPEQDRAPDYPPPP
jgi:hypothetical protein